MSLKDKLKNIRGFRKWIVRLRKINFDIRNGINPWKTLMINFKFLPFNVAIKFPIIVYGRLWLANTTGTLKIEGPITHRMIKWGLNIDRFGASRGAALLDLQGTLVFKGPALLSVDCTVNVGERAVLVMGKYAYCGNGVRIRCWNSIEIGNYTDISLESQIYDTDFHYIRDLETGEIPPCSIPVKIGCFCWTGSRVTMLKGTVVPDYTIIASESLLTKDYSSSVPSGSLIGGIPARLLKVGKARVHDMAVIKEADSYFSQHGNSEGKLSGIFGWMEDQKEIEKFYQSF